MVFAASEIRLSPPPHFHAVLRLRDQFDGGDCRVCQESRGGTQRRRCVPEVLELTLDPADESAAGSWPPAFSGLIQQHPQRIGQTAGQPRRQDARRRQFPEAAGEHQQTAGQIAAINHGHVSGVQWCQRACVVPIEEMPVVPLQARERCERPLRTDQQLSDGTIAEIPGCQIGQDRHADVGRTRSRRDDQIRIQLDVVRRQPVIFRRDTLLKITPCPSRQHAKKVILVFGEPQRTLDTRLAEPPGNQRSRRPEEDHGSCDEQHLTSAHGKQGECHRCQARRGPHRPECAGHAGVTASLRITCCPPFQQPALCPSHADPRPHHCVDGDAGLVRQVDEHEHSAGQWLAQRSKRGPAMHAPGQIDRFAQPSRDRVAQGRQEHDAGQERQHDRRRPRRQSPRAEHNRQHRWRHETAAEVVKNLPA